MDFLIKPWKHQLQTIRDTRDIDRYGLFFEQGTGKTMTLINMLRVKFSKRKRVLRTLILTPRIVVPNWVREFEAHSRVNPDHIIPLLGPGVLRARRFKKRGFGPGGSKLSRIFITNYEALLMNDLYDLFNQWDIEALVLDESHKVKAMTSKRTKLAIKLSEGVRYRYLATGTPMPNGPMDIFPQFRILDGGETFGTNFFSFRNHFFFDRNAGMPKQHHFPDWVIRSDRIATLNRKIKKMTARVKKMECLDLPPLVRQRAEVDLGPEQYRVYREMKKEYIAYIEDKACVAQLAITKGLRLQQILSGFVTMEKEGGESEVHVFDKNPRLTALKELLTDLAPYHKVIVWAVFKKNYEMIRGVCDDIGAKYVEVHGGVSDKDKDSAVTAFNDDPSVRVFIGHPASGGIGINLVASDIAIFYSRNFSLESDLQAEARNHRGGSEKHQSITRIDLVAPETIDEQILEALSRKEKMSEAILRGMIGKI